MADSSSDNFLRTFFCIYCQFQIKGCTQKMPMGDHLHMDSPQRKWINSSGLGLRIPMVTLYHSRRGIYAWIKIESTESREPAVLANRSREPTKLLSCDSRSALLTKEGLAIFGAPVNCRFVTQPTYKTTI